MLLNVTLCRMVSSLFSPAMTDIKEAKAWFVLKSVKSKA
jgi:hypothetical protein